VDLRAHRHHRGTAAGRDSHPRRAVTQRSGRAARLTCMRTVLRPAVVATLALLLVACAPGAAPSPLSYDTGVRYYPACGNEVLSHGGTTWYPFLHDEDVPYPEGYGRDGMLADPADPADAAAAALAGQGPLVLALGASGSVPRVAPPGPGDDVGTLTVFSEGIAFFESDSGDLSIWLTDEPRKYPWVC